ncbi:phytanoyl-CoA dioxygenase family protein [Pseudarthrobacter sp. MEB009]|uniref:phytanoyl-CoA dioxygenase family protein n=1 Tax=Pseudarthrobacter sp. MEB009 TaxID=3040326 RepID=UPI00255582F5|nr:phytanoyl-CoA dioxygenase family protein [Pseudarthrobacter sp. MEB009]
MHVETPAYRLTQDQVNAYHHTGFTVARGLFSAAEAADCAKHFDALAETGEPIEGHWAPQSGTDPLARYPRMFHPHLFDAGSKQRLLDPRVKSVLTQLMADEPIAVQSMYYFKPPGARGQAFHQDNYFLKIKPQSCLAAWLAIDPSTPENGGLQLCPGTQDMEVVCPDSSDPAESFTKERVQPPEGHEPVKLSLAPGDVLLFNGSVVHGSDANRTSSQWRRSFISHYMPASATHVGRWYAPAMMDFDGRPVARASNEDGGPCGSLPGDPESGLH